MVSISVSGNMNHVAMKHIRVIVSNEEWHGLVLEKLRETSRNREGLRIAYSMLVSCFVDAGMVDLGVDALRKVRQFGFFPSSEVYNSLLRVLLKTKRLELAWQVFAEMPDWEKGSKGMSLKPDLILYNTLIRGFCNVGDVNEACQLLIAMKEDGIFPDNTTYRALVHGLERKRIENAEEIVAMKVQDTYMKNGFVLNESLHCACEYGDVADMDEILPMDLTNEFLTAQM